MTEKKNYELLQLLKEKKKNIGSVGALDFLINYYSLKKNMPANSNKSNINVSVVIPTCDRDNMLEKSFFSVKKQINDGDEIIIVDNGRAKSNFARLASQVGTVYCRLNPYCGVSVARNIGLETAKNNWVVFLDDDDYWPDDYLRVLKKHIASSLASAFLTRKDRLFGNEVKIYKTPSKKALTIENLLYKNGGAGGSNLAVNREVALSIGGFDRRLHKREDRSFVLDLIISGYNVEPIVETGVITRESADGTELDRLSAPGKDDYIRDFMFYTKYSNFFSVDERKKYFDIILAQLKDKFGIANVCNESLQTKSIVKKNNKVKIVYFCITLRPKIASNDWLSTCKLLQCTLNSILSQTDDSYQILIAGHEVPDIPELKNPKVEFIKCLYEPFSSKNLRRKDKSIKKKILASHVRKKGGGFIMPVDADDLISSHLVSAILKKSNYSWFVVDKGYVIDEGKKLIFEFPRVGSRPFYETCGTCAIFYMEKEDLPIVDDHGKLKGNSNCLYAKIKSHHTWFGVLTPIIGLPGKLDFPAVAYIFNHADNISKDFVGLNDRYKEMAIPLEKNAIVATDFKTLPRFEDVFDLKEYRIVRTHL